MTNTTLLTTEEIYLTAIDRIEKKLLSEFSDDFYTYGKIHHIIQKYKKQIQHYLDRN